MDASFDKTTAHVVISAIGKNHEGVVLTDLVKKMIATSPLVAEALAMREAASLAVNLGMPRVILESDYLELVQTCRGEVEKGEISIIVQYIKRLRDHFLMCGLTWIARQGNTLAHTLAQMFKRNNLPTNWRRSPPS